MGRYYVQDAKLLNVNALINTVSHCEDFLKLDMLQKKGFFGVHLLHRNPL